MMELAVHYEVFPGKLDADLDELRDQCLSEVAQFVIDYLWHHQPFNLVCDHPNRRLKGQVVFGDNVEDEWFVISLIFHLTRQLDVVACVRDQDGEVLLIESADVLPRWAQNPTLSEGRVFIYRSQVHLIPVAQTPAQLTPIPSSTTPLVDHAIHTVFHYSHITVAAQPIQQAIRQRMKSYPHDWSDQAHVSRFLVPASVKLIVDKCKQLLAGAIHAFCNRDPLDAKAMRRMQHFPGDQGAFVLASFKLTKMLYAMLDQQKYHPAKRSSWHVGASQVGAATTKAQLLGLKLTCGFEILASQASNAKVTDQCLPQLHGPPSSAFSRFVAKLTDSGYFKDELEGSRKYCMLLQTARDYFDQSMASLELPPCPGMNVLQLLDGITEADITEAKLCKASLEVDSDDDSWLTLEPETFDHMLEKHFGPKALDMKIPPAVDKFLHSLSEYDGAEIPIQDPASEDSPISFDPEALESALDKILGLGEDAVIDDEYLEESDCSSTEEEVVDDPQMKQYLDSMDAELSTEGPDAWSKPLDVDTALLKNLMTSYMEQENPGRGPASTLLRPMGIELNHALKYLQSDSH